MGDNWCPATAITQRMDGLFEACVWLPDQGGGMKQLQLPSVDRSDIREAASKAALQIPSRQVVLRVPKVDPVHETALDLLNAAGEDAEPITFSFARPTPPAGEGLESLPAVRAVHMELTRDRASVTADVSHSTLCRYMSTAPCALGCEAGRTRTEWKLMLGPYAEHTVRVEKRVAGAAAQLLEAGASTAGAAGGLLGGVTQQVTGLAEAGVLQKSRIVAVSVDGVLLVEAMAEDFDADWETDASPSTRGGAAWACRFRFVGERSIPFKVFETDEAGVALDTTGLAEGLRKDQVRICKVCTVCVHDLADLSTAALDVDGTSFSDMQQYSAPAEEEEPIACDAQALKLQYGILPPFRVRDAAPRAGAGACGQQAGIATVVMPTAEFGQHSAGMPTLVMTTGD